MLLKYYVLDLFISILGIWEFYYMDDDVLVTQIARLWLLFEKVTEDKGGGFILIYATIAR